MFPLLIFLKVKHRYTFLKKSLQRNKELFIVTGFEYCLFKLKLSWHFSAHSSQFTSVLWNFIMVDTTWTDCFCRDALYKINVMTDVGSTITYSEVLTFPAIHRSCLAREKDREWEIRLPWITCYSVRFESSFGNLRLRSCLKCRANDFTHCSDWVFKAQDLNDFNWKIIYAFTKV